MANQNPNQKSNQNPDFDPKIMLKNITKSITDYGTIMGERNKLQAEQLANRIKLNENWLFKLRQQKESPEGQMQQQMGQMFQRQEQPPAGAGPGQIRPFAEAARPRVRMGARGYQMHYPTQKEFIHSRIQEKRRREIPLTEKEERFEESYLGIKERKKDYLLVIPPKELETKKRGFWSQVGDAMLRTIMGRPTGVIAEADRTATITEAKRKYARGEALIPEEATLLTMNAIKTKQDIEELLENREQYEAEGVDVRLILDFFAPPEEE